MIKTWCLTKSGGRALVGILSGFDIIFFKNGSKISCYINKGRLGSNYVLVLRSVVGHHNHFFKEQQKNDPKNLN